MDAVVFMEAMRPPAAEAAPGTDPPSGRRISPSAALITGVATLLLALGIGVLIGRSGEEVPAPAAAAAPIVIRGGSGEAETASTSKEGTIGGSGAKKSKQSSTAKQEAETNPKGAEEVLKPASDVKLPPPTTGVGDKCEKGTAGCQGGEFTGNFFGE
jgi:hypothetical protein